MPKSSPTNRCIALKSKLFHARNSQGLVTPAWYTRVTINRERTLFNLGLDLDRATELDRALRKCILEGIITEPENAHTWLRKQQATCCRNASLPLTSCHDGPPTIGDLLDLQQRSYFEAKPSTTYRYAMSLLNLVEVALNRRKGLSTPPRTGRRNALWSYTDILAQPLTVLDDALVVDFKAARMQGVARGTAEEKSRKISTNTELRQARCVFSREAMQVYRHGGLELPNLSLFMGAPRFSRVVCRPQMPPDTLLISVFQKLEQLRQDDNSDLYVVIGLALLAGLRRNEIRHARRSWLQTTNGPSLVIHLSEEFTTKNQTERTVPLPSEFFANLQRIDRSFLLQGDSHDRERTLDRAVVWLRNLGFRDVPKPLHTLRAFYAGYLLAAETSPFRIRSRLGHADLTTTFRHYADEPLADHLVALWQQAGLPGPVGASSWMRSTVKDTLTYSGLSA